MKSNVKLIWDSETKWDHCNEVQCYKLLFFFAYFVIICEHKLSEIFYYINPFKKHLYVIFFPWKLVLM